METFQKFWQVWKYYVQDCLRIFLLLSSLEKTIRVSGNSPIVAERRMFYPPKKPPTKVESFPMTLFDLNQIREKILTENCSIQVFSTAAIRYISMKSLRRALSLWKISNYWSLKKNGTSYKQKFVYTDSHGQNIWNIVKK